jgi:hypothetical protein
MVKINEVVQLNELAFVPALFWALAGAGFSLSAYQAYQIYSAWHDGQITDDELKVRIGVQAAETILNFGAIAGVAQGAKLGWRAFNGSWKQASRQEPPMTRSREVPINRDFDREQPMSSLGQTGNRNPAYNPRTGRTDPPLRREN